LNWKSYDSHEFLFQICFDHPLEFGNRPHIPSNGSVRDSKIQKDQRVRTGRESRSSRGKLKERRKNTKRREQKTRQRMMLQMMKLKEAGMPAGRKGGGIVGMWKPS